MWQYIPVESYPNIDVLCHSLRIKDVNYRDTLLLGNWNTHKILNIFPDNLLLN